MTRSHDADSPFDGPLDEELDPVLHSFAVIARFRLEAPTGQEAEAAVRKDLQVLGGAYSDAKVEPQEPDGSWAVDVRFVVASVDGELAVEGVHSTLREQGLEPSEAWVAERLP